MRVVSVCSIPLTCVHMLWMCQVLRRCIEDVTGVFVSDTSVAMLYGAKYSSMTPCVVNHISTVIQAATVLLECLESHADDPVWRVNALVVGGVDALPQCLLAACSARFQSKSRSPLVSGLQSVVDTARRMLSAYDRVEVMTVAL